MSSSSAAPLQWRLSQILGEAAPGEKVEDVDTISALEFDSRGNYLAAGDYGGRIILFERSSWDYYQLGSRNQLELMDYPAALPPRYVYKTEFQSHELEFDYMNSSEIGEKINKLKWCTQPNSSLFILSANNRTIKLWKVSEHKSKKVKEVEESLHVPSENVLLGEKSFLIGKNDQAARNGYYLEWTNKKPRSASPTSNEGPNKVLNIGEGNFAKCRRIYAHAHDYNINSISNNSDGETFISSDELRINLWNLEVSNRCFNIVDMKPLDMEDLSEVITQAEFHPSYCNLLAFSSSRGFIRLVDLRQSALCDQNVRILQDRETHISSFFSEIVSCISDIKFAKDGRHILSRNYMNLKLWDLHMERSPVATFKIHEYLRPKLSELYNSDSIFDKFGCCISNDGHHFATGSYSNTLKVFSHNGGHDDAITLEASRTSNRRSHPSFHPKVTGLLTSFARLNRRGHENPSSDGNDDISCDLDSKLIHLAWHPTTNFIACAAKGSLYMYHA
ncbi:serine/threonine protein phosphatase 2A 55 kDa regulatory subunit B beta isoform-like isoform X1 [Typha latifolia]|uniref:serine/threonine protein phosphatase 2A 55 kDa regulatory subunit B beta isoform-like isoform X1 n=1 Tax=Typha latifolia TaxID=4733 RepID=UPI003C2DBB64